MSASDNGKHHRGHGCIVKFSTCRSSQCAVWPINAYSTNRFVACLMTLNQGEANFAAFV